MSIIRNPALADEGIRKINWVKHFMPILTSIGDEYAQSKPFAGRKITLSVHMEAKTAYLAYTLKRLGAEVHATGCNPLSTQDDVAAGLAKLGVNVFAMHDVDNETYFELLKQAMACHPDLIIDDGGDLVDTYINRIPTSEHWYLIGGCEETTTGVHRLRARLANHTLPFPMVNVNDAKCKHFYDNKYGTGQSVWTSIMSITNTLTAGKTIVIAGYGYCGKGLAMRARGVGAEVIVTEIDAVKAIEAKLDGFKVMTMDEAAPLGDYFITATGCRDVITGKHFAKMKNGVFLANAGHFDVEVDVNWLDSYCKKSHPRKHITEYQGPAGIIYVLAEGRLVNLAGGDGHPAEIMDMSFSVQTLSLMFLLDKHQKTGLKDTIYEVPEYIDNKVSKLKLKSLGITIDSLTEAQKEYLDLV